jgi:drug/metabolite transporter (DMT)-like permease
VVYLLALAAALINAVSSILQRLGVEDAPSKPGLSTNLISHMLRRPVWIMGFVLMAFGFVAQATALHLGSLAVVQPLLVSELIFVVGALWLWYSMPVSPRDLVASTAAAAGLACFLAAASPISGTRVPSDRLWIVTGLIIVGAAVALVVAGLRGPGWWRALFLGAGASLGFALTAALTKTTTDLLGTSWARLFGSWPLYALAVIGLSSFLLMQQAFQAGPFAASQSTLILINPFASIVIGVVLFGDHLHSSVLSVTFEVVGLVVMVGGAIALASSPMIVGVHNESPDDAMLAGRGRYARWRAARRPVSAPSP